MTRGILLGLLICALTFGIVYVVLAYWFVFAGIGAGVAVYCYGLIGKEEKF